MVKANCVFDHTSQVKQNGKAFSTATLLRAEYGVQDDRESASHPRNDASCAQPSRIGESDLAIACEGNQAAGPRQQIRRHPVHVACEDGTITRGQGDGRTAIPRSPQIVRQICQHQIAPIHTQNVSQRHHFMMKAMLGQNAYRIRQITSFVRNPCRQFAQE